MTKKDLVSGMFGKDNEGAIFVVAGSRIIFENGTYNDIEDMNDEFEFVGCDAYVDSLYTAHCFDDVKDGTATLIWKHEYKKCECATKPNNAAITITVDEFLKVADKVNEEWMRVAEEHNGVDVVNAIVGLQNTTFAAHLAAELFG